MPAYFGYTGGTSTTSLNNRWRRNKSYVTGYACPGSGEQQIVELSALCSRNDDSNLFRIAVYDEYRNLVAQGSSAFLPSNVISWDGHMTPAAITPYPAILIGGVTYHIAIGANLSPTAPTIIGGTPGGTDGGTTAAVDYATNGFPSELADAEDSTIILNVRCGVEPYPHLLGGGFHTDDRFRFRPSCLSAYSIGVLRRYSAIWPPDAGILNPELDSLADNDSRIIN